MRFFSVLSLSLALFLAVLVPVSADPVVQLLPDDPAPISSSSLSSNDKIDNGNRNSHSSKGQKNSRQKAN